MGDAMTYVTQIIGQIETGDGQAVGARLPLLSHELRKLAAANKRWGLMCGNHRSKGRNGDRSCRYGATLQNIRRSISMGGCYEPLSNSPDNHSPIRQCDVPILEGRLRLSDCIVARRLRRNGGRQSGAVAGLVRHIR